MATESTRTSSTQRVSGPLRTERMDNGNRQLLRDLIYQIGPDTITVPSRTETDFSTFPWYGRMLVRWSKVDVAGVVHDWLYQKGEPSRRYADRIWRLVAVDGHHRANAFQAWTAWLGIRAVGWIYWRRHRRVQQ